MSNPKMYAKVPQWYSIRSERQIYIFAKYLVCIIPDTSDISPDSPPPPHCSNFQLNFIHKRVIVVVYYNMPSQFLIQNLYLNRLRCERTGVLTHPPIISQPNPLRYVNICLRINIRTYEIGFSPAIELRGAKKRLPRHWSFYICSAKPFRSPWRRAGNLWIYAIRRFAFNVDFIGEVLNISWCF